MTPQCAQSRRIRFWSGMWYSRAYALSTPLASSVSRYRGPRTPGPLPPGRPMHIQRVSISELLSDLLFCCTNDQQCITLC